MSTVMAASMMPSLLAVGPVDKVCLCTPVSEGDQQNHSGEKRGSGGEGGSAPLLALAARRPGLVLQGQQERKPQLLHEY